MPNLVGIGLSQVPTNSMLGGMAYQDPDRVKIKKLNVDEISQINSEIADTAVDIFIYDTSKDSDGGAWRKRTTNTSWYNETLGTETRGTRREFPSVAVIVTETRKVTIYDGDDPNLPMWMVFNAGTGNALWYPNSSNATSTVMLNGKLANAAAGGSPRFRTIDFLSDSHLEYSHTDGRTTFNINVSQRNAGASSGFNYGNVPGAGLIHRDCNDVAMTVLPNAPVDSATGLPVPTIAVATDAGVSVIKDNGTVVDIRRTSDDDVHHVDFNGDRVIMFMELGAIYVATIPNSDQSGNPNGGWSVYGSYGGNTSGTDHPAIQAYGAGVDLVSMKDHTFATAGFNDSNNLYKGLSILSENVNSSGNGMAAWIRSDCNTGWMHGDIKGAFLSDTDTTNATDSNVVTNGTFDSNTNSWSGDSGATVSWDSGGFASVGNGGGDNTFAIAQSGILVSGAKYRITGRVQPSMSGSYEFRVRAGGSGTQWNKTSGLTNGQWYSFDTGIITADGTTLEIGSQGGTITNFYLDDVYVWKLEEEDRSVNNKGLEVHGTVTKSAVATGADLVAYSGFSHNNYLRQPHNADLNVGTGDFYIMCWVKGNRLMLWHRNDSGSLDMRCEFPTSGGSANKPRFMMSNGGVTISFYGTYAFDTTTWHHCVWVKRGARNGELYIDGVLNNSGSTGSDLNLNGNNSKFTIGNRSDSPTEDFNGYISLFKFGASAPSAEQVKKIYNDEKHLFQENAKAALYGSSDAVTALAYDEVTGRLHAGTSGGRSDFQGLRRINNTTTAVTTAISAHDGFIVEQ